MWTDTNIYKEDMEYILHCECINWNRFKNKNILISGGTGLIGSTLIYALLYANKQLKLQLKIFVIVRNMQKAEEIFGTNFYNSDTLYFIEGTVEEKICCGIDFDFIIHGASPTKSKYFITNPVETIRTMVEGTLNLLELIKNKTNTSFVYLSSMEVYGEIDTEDILEEQNLGYIDLQNIRNCYSQSKRTCEVICEAYASEYKIHTTSIRLAQTFGPGIAYNDNRVFAMMARCVLENEDIILQTKGQSKHSYLYTAQAVTAILCVLLNGESGQVYNAANPKTYCSIYEMGEMIVNSFSENKIKIRVCHDADRSCYPSDSYLNLGIRKIEELGWYPEGTLYDMYNRMLATMVQR